MYAASFVISWISAILLWLVRDDQLSAFGYAFLWPFGILLVPRLLYRQYRHTVNREWLRYAESITLALLLINAPGAIYFHTDAASLQYDRFLHIAGGALTLLMLVLVSLAASGSVRRTRQMVPWLIVIAVALQGLWEVFQYFSDGTFGSIMFFDGTQAIAVDVAEDIFFGITGIFAALPYILLRLLEDARRFFRTS
jgi:hypothetical protein